MNYRNPKILQLAKEAPNCMYCGRNNDGSVVAAHMNGIEYGKGMGQKAHDVPAYLCNECHAIADGRLNPGGIVMTKQDRERILLLGAWRTWLWLMQSGHLEVA